MNATPSNPFVRWGESLLADPAAALDALLSGRAALGVQQRAEPADFLADLLAQPHWETARPALTDRLDQALLGWLQDRRAWGLGRIQADGTRAYMTELADGLAVAARLPLAQTTRTLIAEQVTWDNRLNGLRWPGDIDVLRRFDLVLIAHQPDTRFLPRWFAACERAAWGGPQWHSDLTTGLLGLRKLPHGPGAVPERPVAIAVARFAALAESRGLPLTKIQTAFQRAAGALTVLYPRQDQHWQDLWTEVLADLRRAPAHRQMAERVASAWLPGILPTLARPVQTAMKATTGRPAKIPAGHVVPPTKEERDARMAAIRRTVRLDAALWVMCRGFMERHWAYAEASGNNFPAILSLHMIATGLLRLTPGSEVLTVLHGWTLRAIELEPNNAFVWGLWGRLLDALGQPEAALAVRWETVRRFPNNPVLRVELVDLLRRRGKPVIAEHLLRETQRDFPDNVVCRNALADLLRETHRLDEAETVLRKAQRDFRTDDVCRNALADLLRETGRTDEAEQLLLETRRDFSRDVVCRHMLASLYWRQRRRDEAEAILNEAESLAPQNPYVQKLAEIIRGPTELTDDDLAVYELPMPFYLTARTETWGDQSGAAADLGPHPEPSVARPAAAQHGRGPVPPTTETPTTDSPTAPDAVSRVEEPDHVTSTTNDSAASTYAFLDLLRGQATLIQAHFAPGSDGGADQTEALRRQAGTSDLALVTAHRAGLLDGPQGQATLHDWVELRPQSYAARLLLTLPVATGGTDGGLDPEALDAIGRDFPERRAWTDPLRLAFQSPAERSAYLAGLRDSRDPQDQRLWDGRLTAVYPDLEGSSERIGIDPTAMRRLVEDIALSQADRATPSLALN